MESHTGNFKKYGNSQRGQRIDNQSEITDLLYIMGGYMVKKMIEAQEKKMAGK